MNVIVTIDGREAVPVRAIPMLTTWQVLTPDELANLAATRAKRKGQIILNTHRLEGGRVLPVSWVWWEQYVVRPLLAIEKGIRAQVADDDIGLQQWEDESLRALPAGVFVWRDELEELHRRKFGPEGEVVGWGTDEGEMDSGDVAGRYQTLDFEPRIPDKWMTVVMDGFDSATDPDGIAGNPSVEKSSHPPLQRQQSQELAILAAIRNAGYRPDALPPMKKGKRWVKSEIWDALKNNTVFISRGVFDGAWERLRGQGDLKEAVSP